MKIKGVESIDDTDRVIQRREPGVQVGNRGK